MCGEPMGRVHADYDPHMTLINTREPDCADLIAEQKKRFQPLTDAFLLSIGRCDEIGQVTEILQQARPNNV